MVNNYDEGISVIIPVYNAEKYICECVRSVLNQSYRNLEIILVDDGSTDNSFTLLNSLQKEDLRIKVIHKDNGGVSSARNVGINSATKKYITFVDSDDTIETEMYKNMIEFAEKSNLDCVVCGINSINVFKNSKVTLCPKFENGKIITDKDIIEYIIKPSLGFSKGNAEAMYSVWNKLFSRKVIRENKLYFNENRNHGEDWQFCIDFFAVASSVGVLIDTYYNYIHRSADSLINRYRDNYFETALFDRKHFMELLPDFEWSNKEKTVELQMQPINAAIHYRMHLKKRELMIKYREMFELIKQSGIYDGEILIEDGEKIRKAINSNDFSLFVSLITKQTNGIVFKKS